MAEKFHIIGEMIFKFNEIEFYFKQIIIKYLKPEQKFDKFYSQVLFNNSIISFSAKIKLFQNINNEMEWITGKKLDELIRFVYYLNNVRNSLVHTENAIEFEKDEKGNIINAYDIIDFFKTDGSLNVLRINEVYKIFNERYLKIKKELLKIYNEI